MGFLLRWLTFFLRWWQHFGFSFVQRRRKHARNFFFPWEWMRKVVFHFSCLKHLHADRVHCGGLNTLWFSFSYSIFAAWDFHFAAVVVGWLSFLCLTLYFLWVSCTESINLYCFFFLMNTIKYMCIVDITIGHMENHFYSTYYIYGRLSSWRILSSAIMTGYFLRYYYFILSWRKARCI